MNDVYGITKTMICVDRVKRNITILRSEKKKSCPKKSTKQTQTETLDELTDVARLTNSLLFVIALTHSH